MPTKLEKQDDGTIVVSFEQDGAVQTAVFDTVRLNLNDAPDPRLTPLSLSPQVLFAVGRDPCTRGIGLENVGIQLDSK